MAINVLILKFILLSKRTQNSQLNIEEKQSENQHYLTSSLTKATIIKTVWYWCKNRQASNRTEVEGPETDPQVSQLTFDKGAKQYNEAKTSFFFPGS